MKIILTGATGMVGSETLQQSLNDNSVAKVLAIVRKPLSIAHSKLEVVIHTNFLDFSNLSDFFKEYDACLWCLGISQSKVKNETEYHRITFDYAVNAARIMLQANPAISFLFLSGMGADSEEKSRTLFARVKGKTENALLKLPFKHFYILRPGGIQPQHWNSNAPFSEKIVYPLFPLFKLLMPKFVITSVQLAKAMLYIAKHNTDKQILENSDLLLIAKYNNRT